MIDLKNKIPEYFTEYRERIIENDLSGYTAQREEALRYFIDNGFPDSTDESWKNTRVAPLLQRNFSFNQEDAGNPDYERIFSCDIPAFDAHIVALYNGEFVSRESKSYTLPNGTIVASLSSAMELYPELIRKYLNRIAESKRNGFTALNTAFAHEGLFIYVPDNVEAYKAIQLVNTMNGENNNFIQNRNLIILGKNAQLKFIHCDDSNNQLASFSNMINEIYLDEGASLNYYRYQNINNLSGLINSTFVNQKANSDFRHDIFTLNGGLVRNEFKVGLTEAQSNAEIYGLYLMDRDQHVDNQLFIDHAVPHCTSTEWFKGIIDDHASGVFNGHVLVRKDAQQTRAYQTNNNILLTDKAKVHTTPFLEIYADDVKCSHGATIGQLNDDVMFYLRSRGVNEKDARLLQMFAFTADIINHIEIEPLKDRTEDLVKKRLRGELDNCDHCVLQCKSPAKKFTPTNVI